MVYAAASTMGSGLSRRRLLIVDDDPDVLTSLAAWFQAHFEVVTASDGVEALAVVDALPVDVVVLDLMMPNMDGEAFKRTLDERGLAIPVIIASAASDVAGSARRLGVAGFVVKPIDLDHLEAMVARAADGGGSSGAPPAGGKPGGSRSGKVGPSGSLARPAAIAAWRAETSVGLES